MRDFFRCVSLLVGCIIGIAFFGIGVFVFLSGILGLFITDLPMEALKVAVTGFAIASAGAVIGVLSEDIFGPF